MDKNSKNYPPGIPIDYPKEEAKEAIKKAKVIFQAIKDKIEPQ